MNADSSLFEGEQSLFAQLTQDAVDVDSAQTQGVAENGLAKRALELCLHCQTHQAESFCKLHEEMRRALGGVAATDVYEVFDYHGFVS